MDPAVQLQMVVGDELLAAHRTLEWFPTQMSVDVILQFPYALAHYVTDSAATLLNKVVLFVQPVRLEVTKLLAAHRALVDRRVVHYYIFDVLMLLFGVELVIELRLQVLGTDLVVLVVVADHLFRVD